MRHFARPLVLAFATALLTVPGAAWAQGEGEVIAGAAAVLQADQIVIDGQRISIFGIDAPDPDQDRQCSVGRQLFGCYTNAKRQMEILVDEGPVTCTGTGEFNYVAFPYMTCETASGEDIGEIMVRNGMAVAFLPQTDVYLEKQQEAEAAERGLWQPGIRFILPWEWRQINSRPVFGP